MFLAMPRPAKPRLASPSQALLYNEDAKYGYGKAMYNPYFAI